MTWWLEQYKSILTLFDWNVQNRTKIRLQTPSDLTVEQTNWKEKESINVLRYYVFTCIKSALVIILRTISKTQFCFSCTLKQLGCWDASVASIQIKVVTICTASVHCKKTKRMKLVKHCFSTSDYCL